MTPFRILCSCLLLLAFAASYVACADRIPDARTPAADHDRRTGLPVVSVLTPDLDRVAPLTRALRSELAADFDVVATRLGEREGVETLRAVISRDAPVLVVLVDNRPAALFSELARQQQKLPPALLLMSSFVEQAQRTVPNSTAIAFESPAVVTLVDLRAVLGRRVRRAGVVYRAGFERFIALEQKRAEAEKIELVSRRVPRRPSTAALGRALHWLERNDVDAVWVSNDNLLLSRSMLAQAWLPFAEQASMPIVVGVPALVDTRVPFGTYAAVPDLEGLGLQAAELIYRIQSEHWNAGAIPLQPAYSTKTYLNVEQARRFGAPRTAYERVDVLVDYDAR